MLIQILNVSQNVFVFLVLIGILKSSFDFCRANFYGPFFFKFLPIVPWIIFTTVTIRIRKTIIINYHVDKAVPRNEAVQSVEIWEHSKKKNGKQRVSRPSGWPGARSQQHARKSKRRKKQATTGRRAYAAAGREPFDVSVGVLSPT